MKSTVQCYNKITLTGGESERDRLVLSAIGLVVGLATRVKEQSNTLLEVEDLIQEGIMGLFKAAPRYAAVGAKFTTFAYWHIRSNMFTAIEKDRAVHGLEKSEVQKRKVERKREGRRRESPEARERRLALQRVIDKRRVRKSRAKKGARCLSKS